MPCSCYNSSATNDSTVFEKMYFSQPGGLGSRARSRHNTDLCSVPAYSHIYREVAEIWIRSCSMGGGPAGGVAS